MGNSLTGYHVRHSSQGAVAAALREIVSAHACVTRPVADWVSAYDEVSERQDTKELRRIALGLSSRLGAQVVAVLLQDSDILLYLLCEDARLVDEYDSCPDYFGDVDEDEQKRTRGRPEVLQRFCRADVTLDQLSRVLDRNREFTFEEERLEELAGLLGIKKSRFCRGFNDGRTGLFVTGNGYDPIPERLVEAIEAKDFSRVRALLAQGAPVDVTVPGRGSPLLTGVSKQVGPALVEVLLEAGARDTRALLCCFDAETARLLLAHGRNVNLKDENGKTALWNAVTWAPLAVGEPAALRLVEVLLEAGAEVGGRYEIQYLVPRRKERGLTVLMYAASGGHAELVKALLAAGADPDVRLEDGRTAADIAEAKGRKEVVRLLRERG